MSDDSLKFLVWYIDHRLENDEFLGEFDTLEEARASIEKHPQYKKSWFGKRGKATSRHPRYDEGYIAFKIYDNKSFFRTWTIRD